MPKFPKFDDAGNIILSKKAQEEDYEFRCQYCQAVRTKKGDIIKDSGSLSQHESWCEANPNNRRLKKNDSKPSDKSEKIKKERLSPKVFVEKPVFLLKITGKLEIDFNDSFKTIKDFEIEAKNLNILIKKLLNEINKISLSKLQETLQFIIKNESEK